MFTTVPTAGGADIARGVRAASGRTRSQALLHQPYGQAMGQANRALEGDLSGVTESLGTAFNSTLVALLLSIVLMFLLYQLQQLQEKLVLDAQRECEQRLIQNLQAPS